jgi:DUF1365 family protein
MTASALYRGTLLHTRRDEHAHRTFRYPVYMAAIDPAELPALDARLRLFSHNRRNVFALDDRDYAPNTAELLAANGLPAPVATRLITNLRVLGYVFNPVSFHLGYDRANRLSSVIAEVNNTYGGRFRYVLGPAAELARRGGRVGYRHIRELFVSPFLHGPASYELWFPEQLDPPELAITMHVERPDGERVFVAHLAGTRSPLGDRALAAAAVRYPLMTVQVIGLIHYEALKLHLLGVPFRRPGRDHRPIGWTDSFVPPAHRSTSMK